MIKKFLLIIPLIIFSLFFVNILPVFAADDINMNLTSNSINEPATSTSNNYQVPTQTNYSSTASTSGGLDISNILNILLIVIGILLILLSIAILIRLKH